MIESQVIPKSLSIMFQLKSTILMSSIKKDTGKFIPVYSALAQPSPSISVIMITVKIVHSYANIQNVCLANATVIVKNQVLKSSLTYSI